MYARTCAHREYPFGTILKVTNVSNNREVRCVVNDRGPFVAGRDIDLSYGTARAIGLMSTGKVFINVEGRDESYVRKVKIHTNGMPGPFAVQVGSFTERSNADRLKESLELEYGNVYIQEMKVKSYRRFRVRVGDFESLGKAISFAGKLGLEGYPTLVVKADSGSKP
jgi:peptidoglycan lytic transglycosylase